MKLSLALGQIFVFSGYQPVQDMGLFLFSDALVVTSLTTKHFPLERAFARNHQYDTTTIGVPVDHGQTDCN